MATLRQRFPPNQEHHQERNDVRDRPLPAGFETTAIPLTVFRGGGRRGRSKVPLLANQEIAGRCVWHCETRLPGCSSTGSSSRRRREKCPRHSTSFLPFSWDRNTGLFPLSLLPVQAASLVGRCCGPTEVSLDSFRVACCRKSTFLRNCTIFSVLSKARGIGCPPAGWLVQLWGNKTTTANWGRKRGSLHLEGKVPWGSCCVDANNADNCTPVLDLALGGPRQPFYVSLWAKGVEMPWDKYFVSLALLTAEGSE